MLSNLVEETTNSPGSNLTIDLLGAPQNRRGFVTAFGDAATCYYALSDGVQTEWGIGTVHAGSPNKLDRTTVIGNTAGTTARLTFNGACRVYNEVPAERLPLLGSDGAVLNAMLRNIRTLSDSFYNAGFAIGTTEVDFVSLDVPAGTRRILAGGGFEIGNSNATTVGVTATMVLRQGATEDSRRPIQTLRAGNSAGASIYANGSGGADWEFGGPLPAGYRVVWVARTGAAVSGVNLLAMNAWMLCVLEG
ncbi:hypothetical protein HMPREF9946_02169 [Acetobacteraceae bacterium AT-5844]|nr:hypothetical protein HMPREF9946_02169 [Acetobacteraceae bacterium AT-5844]